LEQADVLLKCSQLPGLHSLTFPYTFFILFLCLSIVLISLKSKQCVICWRVWECADSS